MKSPALTRGCISRAAGVNALISRGVIPSDPRLSLLLGLRGQVALGPQPAAAQPLQTALTRLSQHPQAGRLELIFLVTSLPWERDRPCCPHSPRIC
jgi:hypothetical protein